jgi:UDP-glucose 4-epimerase
MADVALVTGAAGFLGKHVAAALAKEGYRVCGVGHGKPGVPLASWIESDVTVSALQKAAPEPALIVHCAGSGSVAFSVAHPAADRARTVESTREVLDFMAAHAPSARLILPSSAAVYGLATQFPTPETAPLVPVSPYGRHKLEAEELCRKRAREQGLRISLIRFFSVFGNGLRKQLLFDACRKAAAGETLFFGTGKETRDWLHVSDAIALVQTAVEHATSACPVVNGASGVAVPVSDVLGEIFAQLGQGHKPEFTGETRAGDPAHYHADIARARAWGWKPRIGWREGVQQYVDWFRKAGA